MCCFSGSVKHVYNTSIFGRVSERGNQVLIYSMSLDTADEVAMILPIPVKAGPTEESFQFIDLSRYSELFDDLSELFPADLSLSTFGKSVVGGVPQRAKLKVQRVGSFEGSFVPSMGDFDRLDERFRIDSAIWEKLPQYQNFGFAVFKFRAGQQNVHPMAFAFPTASPESIFFPTVHIHDGQVHEREAFDHALYCHTESAEVRMEWQESIRPIQKRNYLRARKTLLMGQHVYKKSVVGEFKNRDFIIAAV